MVLGALTAGLLAACGGTNHPRSITSAAPRSSGRVVHPVRLDRRRPLPPGTPALRAALDRAFAQAGSSSAGSVYDLTDHRSLFALRAGLELPPASVEKLYTSLAVLNNLGPQATLHTTVLGAGHLGGAGVWHGDLYLRGGGDPTFGDAAFNRTWELGYGPTAAQLVDQLNAAGIRRVMGNVIGDGSAFDSRPGPPSNGFAPDVPDLGGQLSALTFDHGSTANLPPAAFAARQLARTMRSAGIEATASKVPGRTPGTARLLASVGSPPMSVLLRLTDVPSDDFFAEMLTKQLGLRFADAGTTAAGARVIADAIAAHGLHPTIVDGSGLSRVDRSSPQDVIDLLRQINGTAAGNVLALALPTVGVNGTVQTIARNTVARGRCTAKTGTLDNVTNLAGYCHSRGNRLLTFALFLDGPSNSSALRLISQMVAAIARV